MALDNAPFQQAILLWLLIAMMNAVLYGCIGLLIVVLPSRQK
jgi:hypothetical protein